MSHDAFKESRIKQRHTKNVPQVQYSDLKDSGKALCLETTGKFFHIFLKKKVWVFFLASGNLFQHLTTDT